MPATPIAACDATTVTLPDGRVVLNFGGCNYLGLANHPAVLRAASEGMARFGLSSHASRETTGNAEPHEALERDLAAFLGTERCLLVPDGYLANIAACQGFAEGGATHALIDSRAHASLADAAAAAGLSVRRFPHADATGLARALEALRPAAAAVMTDGVFTADGEVAGLPALLAELGPADRLLVDDCHGLGVLGPGGRGSTAAWSIRDRRAVITSSLAKGIGVAGGLVAGTTECIDRCTRATAYVCTTPIAPALAAGSHAALTVLRNDPAQVQRLATNAERLRAGLHALGLAPSVQPPCTPIVAFTFGHLDDMHRLSAALLADGFRAPLIRYPGGPAEAYFRLSVTALHHPNHIASLLEALAARLALPNAGAPLVALRPARHDAVPTA